MEVAKRHKLMRDETLFSWVARLHRMSAVTSEKLTYLALFGASKVRLHPYLPAHIRALALNTHSDAEELLEEHTLYPLFRWFGLDPLLKLRVAMMADQGGMALIHAKLPHAKTAFYDGQKFCPQCISEDNKRFGFGYFKTFHQIPGIDACSKHGCLLFGVDGGDFGYDRHLPMPPKNRRFERVLTIQHSLAKFASDTLQLAQWQLSTCPYQALYWATLDQGGLVTPAHHIRLKSVLGELSAHYDEYCFGSELGLPNTIGSFEFVGPLLRAKTHFHCHPTKQLVFAHWLFEGNVTRYLEQIKHQPKPAGPKKKNGNIKRRVITMLEAGHSMLSIQKKTGRSQCFVSRLADLNHLKHSSNSQAFSPDIKRKVIMKAMHGQHRCHIARAVGASVGYVEQVISSVQGLAPWRKYVRHQGLIRSAIQVIKAARKKHPDWRRKEIKENFGPEFFRLYHHDKGLLESLLPAKTPVRPPGKNWSMEDLRLVREIRRLKGARGLPINRVDHLLNSHGFLRKHLEKLPRTRELLSRYGVGAGSQPARDL